MLKIIADMNDYFMKHYREADRDTLKAMLTDAQHNKNMLLLEAFDQYGRFKAIESEREDQLFRFCSHPITKKLKLNCVKYPQGSKVKEDIDREENALKGLLYLIYKQNEIITILHEAGETKKC